MEPRGRRLRLYTQPSTHPPLAWGWVDAQLTAAGTYWVIARSAGHPHPRPVWGVWHGELLHLSVGSPVLRAALAEDSRVTVHLDSGTHVVIVEGTALTTSADDRAAVQAYDAKYDWEYDAVQYGALTRVAPSRVFGWRTAGPAGRESFTETGSWDWAGGRQPP